MEKQKILFVVDMQNDFIDGVLGSEDARAIVPAVAKKIKDFNGEIVFTQDTHLPDRYFQTQEGRKLPIFHCMKNTEGWQINKDVLAAAETKGAYTVFEKSTFASTSITIPIRAAKATEVEFIGICTDICVISNVMYLKALYPEMKITVDSKCCAGTTPEAHNAALTVMKSCQIDVI